MIIVLQQGEQVMIWPWLCKILQSSTIRVTIQKQTSIFMIHLKTKLFSFQYSNSADFFVPFENQSDECLSCIKLEFDCQFSDVLGGSRE